MTRHPLPITNNRLPDKLRTSAERRFFLWTRFALMVALAYSCCGCQGLPSARQHTASQPPTANQHARTQHTLKRQTMRSTAPPAAESAKAVDPQLGGGPTRRSLADYRPQTAPRSQTAQRSQAARVTDAGPASPTDANDRLAAGNGNDRRQVTRLATDASRPALPAAVPVPVPARTVVPVSHTAPPHLPSEFSEAPGTIHEQVLAAPEGGTVLGNATCGCGRYPAGLCACDQGAFLPPSGSADEYLCNGGDQETQVLVKNDWSVHGLHAGDTVAHFDTLDGDLRVVHSNELCIYAPRFAAVRRVSGVTLHEQHQRGAGVEFADGPLQHADREGPTTATQPLQPQRHLTVAQSQRLEDKQRGLKLDRQLRVAEAAKDLMPFEEFGIVRYGRFENSEKARLATRLDAAVAWTHEVGLQVVFDNRPAVEASGDSQSQGVYRFELPPGKPRLRVVKLASTEQAQPGDVIDFTIRFDNVGDQVIGNVTVIDRLVSRLEYVPNSEQSTVAAEFFTQETDDESLTLRWELAEPLQVGEGGVIRFQGRVR